MPLTETRIGYPIDIFETPDGLHMEIAGTGLTKNDIDIIVEGDVIRVTYNKPSTPAETEIVYHYRGISRKSFNFGYRITPKFDLSKATADMKNGLLSIFIPSAEAELKAKKITIN